MKIIGFCGDNCSACPRYIATQSGDEEQLKKAAEMWKIVGWRETTVPPNEMICHGCASVEWCRYENIRKCAVKKGIVNCGLCEDYPCKKIKEVFEQTEHYKKACEEICSKEDYECFQKAFFSKKDILDKIHQEHFPEGK